MCSKRAMSTKVRFNTEENIFPAILDHIVTKVEESRPEKEILDSYLIDNDDNRQSLLKILKMECSEGQRLYLVENFIEEYCPWVDLSHMQTMWDYLGVPKYSKCKNVFKEKIPYACILNYPSEKDIICSQIKRSKAFIISLE